MFADALTQPIKNENRIENFLIGGFLYMLPTLLVIFPAIYFESPVADLIALVIIVTHLVPLAGFSIRIIQATILDTTSDIRFNNWRELFITGSHALLILFLYLAPYLVSLSLFAVLGSSGGSLETTVSLLMLPGTLVGIAAIYLIPIALTSYSLGGNVRDAFNIGEVIRTSSNKRYILSFIIAVVFGFVSFYMATLLTIIFIGFFLQFYIQIVVSIVLGSGCGPLLQKETAA